MKELIKYVIAIVIPTIIVVSWLTFTTTCATNMTTGESKCSIPVASLSNVPIVVFVLYTAFYGISVLVSRYRIVKRN